MASPATATEEERGTPYYLSRPKFTLEVRGAGSAEGSADYALTTEYVADASQRYEVWLNDAGSAYDESFNLELASDGRLLGLNVASTPPTAKVVEALGGLAKAGVETITAMEIPDDILKRESTLACDTPATAEVDVLCSLQKSTTDEQLASLLQMEARLKGLDVEPVVPETALVRAPLLRSIADEKAASTKAIAKALADRKVTTRAELETIMKQHERLRVLSRLGQDVEQQLPSTAAAAARKSSADARSRLYAVYLERKAKLDLAITEYATTTGPPAGAKAKLTTAVNSYLQLVDRVLEADKKVNRRDLAKEASVLSQYLQAAFNVDANGKTLEGVKNEAEARAKFRAELASVHQTMTRLLTVSSSSPKPIGKTVRARSTNVPTLYVARAAGANNAELKKLAQVFWRSIKDEASKDGAIGVVVHSPVVNGGGA